MKSPFDEMHAAGTSVRGHYSTYEAWLQRQPYAAMQGRRAEAEMIFRRVGITFAVYGAKDEDGAGTERLIPFDLIPRVIPRHEWVDMEAGLRQRVKALNRFIHDVYHDQDILKAGLVPPEQVLNNSQFRKEMMGVKVPGDVYSHISGIDIVRAGNADGSGAYYVLEDNLRVPSGVSYMLENRKMMMRLFPDLFAMHRVAPVAHYPDLLLETLRGVAPAGVNEPTVVVLTPGMYNSAYFEHAFLAQQMGVELVEGQDLFVRSNFVYMRTTQGPKRVDVIYRRVDDDFLDPQAFRPDSTLGCAGLLQVVRAGNVTLSNAIGTGIADDKSIYPYVPKMVEFYLGEKPILNNVPTYLCRDKEDLGYVLRAPERAGGERSARRRRLRHAGGPGSHQGRDRRICGSAEGQPHQLHRPAHPGAFNLPHLCGSRHCTAPHRPAAFCAVGQRGATGAWWPDAGGLERRLAGGEFVPGWRHQGHLGTRGLRGKSHAVKNRRPPVLDGALHGARREHRPHAGRELPNLAVAAKCGHGPKRAGVGCCPSANSPGAFRRNTSRSARRR